MTLITLRDQESKILEHLVARPKHATPLRRAQALLWLDDGESAHTVAKRLRVSRRTISNWATPFQARRGLDLWTRLAEGARSGRPRTAHGIIDPLILEVIDQAPRERGYRSTVWTAPLLTHDVAERHPIAVSRKSVSLAIARIGRRWKRPRHDLARRAASWRPAQGGSNEGSAAVYGPSS